MHSSSQTSLAETGGGRISPDKRCSVLNALNVSRRRVGAAVDGEAGAERGRGVFVELECRGVRSGGAPTPTRILDIFADPEPNAFPASGVPAPESLDRSAFQDFSLQIALKMAEMESGFEKPSV
jgi:hypothetical protein